MNNKTFIRVQYSDTDQMGVVHHSNFVRYCETARWELFRNYGISYKSIEDLGYYIPVIRMNFHYIKTTHYDDVLTIETSLKAIKSAKIWFSYKIYNSLGELLIKAETELAFIKKDSWKPCSVPVFVLKALQKPVNSYN